ncbi:MAG TPA: sugar phosphate isomerase/epimerase family protein [Candidatus Binatia bacterium]|nr:sugar phosphate isomerase/epimerase family protein [Candidatus Binatia bacterium]
MTLAVNEYQLRDIYAQSLQNLQEDAMEVAISSLLFKSHRLDEVIDLSREHGVGWLEVWSEHLWRDDKGDLVKRLRNSGLSLSVHGPISDLNITSSNPGIRQESMRQVLQGIEESAAMGARVITIHPGYLTGRQDGPEGIWDMQISAFTRFASRGKELGLAIAMETMEKRNKEVVIHPEVVNQIIDAVNMDNFGVTFDISHAHTVMDVVEFIRALRKISHIHISDTKQGKVHVLMGEGEIAFGPVLRALKEKYDGALVIEGWNPEDELGMVQRSTAFLTTQLGKLTTNLNNEV